MVYLLRAEKILYLRRTRPDAGDRRIDSGSTTDEDRAPRGSNGPGRAGPAKSMP